MHPYIAIRSVNVREGDLAIDIPYRRIALLMLLLLLMPGSTGDSSVFSQTYAETTAYVQPSSGTVSPGEVFTINAGGGPVDGGMILNYSRGVTQFGEPTCYLPCGSYEIDGANRVVHVDSLGSEINVEIRFQVDESIQLGSWITFSVTIVGGNPNLKMSSTSVQVVAAESMPQNDASLEITPQVQARAFTSPSVIFAEPGGSFYINVLYNIWGLASDQNVQSVLRVTLPTGISIAGAPQCGNESSLSELSECDNYLEPNTTSDMLTFDPAEPAIILHLTVETSINVGTTMEIGLLLTTSIDAPTVEKPLRISIVEPGALPEVELSEKVVGVELHGDYNVVSSNVCEPVSPLDLSLYSWGDLGATLYSTRPEYSSGTTAKSSLDPNQEVCRIYVRFSSVPSGIERMLLANTSEPGFLCRACVLEALLPTKNAITVVPIGYIPTD